MNEECKGSWKDVDINDVLEKPNEWLKEYKIIVASEMSEI